MPQEPQQQQQQQQLQPGAGREICWENFGLKDLQFQARTAQLHVVLLSDLIYRYVIDRRLIEQRQDRDSKRLSS